MLTHLTSPIAKLSHAYLVFLYPGANQLTNMLLMCENEALLVVEEYVDLARGQCA